MRGLGIRSHQLPAIGPSPSPLPAEGEATYALAAIVASLLGTALIVLSLRPSVYDPVFNWFDIVPGAERRVIFVLVIGVLLLLFLVLRLQTGSDP